jgi:hypothetical protein
VLPEFSQTKLLACGEIVEKHGYLALATTGVGSSAVATGSPVSGFTTIITGFCVDEPKMGALCPARAGRAACTRTRESKTRFSMGHPTYAIKVWRIRNLFG